MLEIKNVTKVYVTGDLKQKALLQLDWDEIKYQIEGDSHNE